MALVEKGIDTNRSRSFTESDDYDFWDRYARYPDESRTRPTSAPFTKHYYIDPLLQRDKPSDHPHRGPWTIRTRTFLNSWKAAEFESSTSSWRLKANFAEVFVQKVLSKNGGIHRVPIVDLAIWLFRRDEFPDAASAKSLEERFLSVFPFQQADYDAIFEFTDEEASKIFQDERPSAAAYRDAIQQALVPEVVVPPPVRDLFPSADSGRKSLLSEDDPVLRQVQSLLGFSTSGIILRGCPGTSKTWYAKQIARELVADPAHIYEVQFHPSYGYEDFVEGYLPDQSTRSGFKIVDKLFLQACELASKIDTWVVLIVDEINRGDPARILGEVLTYLEHGYRGMTFRKAYSNGEARVPSNLFLIGTMNPFDRSITQLDLALIRRLDHIDLRPSSEILASFLEDSALTSDQIDRVIKWFEALQNILPVDSGGIGHTYFKDVARPDQLRLVWQYRMLPYCESILELEPQKLEHTKKRFEAMYRSVVGQETVGEEEGI